MERGLVLTSGTDLDVDLLAEAAATARGAGRSLVVLALLSPDSIEADLEQLDAIGEVEGTEYSEHTVLNAERDALQSTVAEVVDTDTTPVECHARVAPTREHVEVVLDLADRSDCGHLYVEGARRSPTGKALFGDVTQQLLLQFPGYVTVSLE